MAPTFLHIIYKIIHHLTKNYKNHRKNVCLCIFETGGGMISYNKESVIKKLFFKEETNNDYYGVRSPLNTEK